ncbi:MULTISPECIES: glycosyltransferase family 4 protein [unclassified Cobetia]|uniref:glycosyltransferase family 4 protein n=1 Tax=unclassified Cobetia TaxID=2609414 RepID=UPI00178CC240|nr:MULTISPECIES: glycosyltransferase family 4 protein [unclassified Cobetia]MBE2170233.1 glycosyltransferase family 4 protein [Cobetia sp. 2AS1]MDH2446985.1 glycosyltransferase family 4 protein [Cobetia sp. 2AS]
MIKVSHVQLLPLLSGVQRVTLDELERLNDETIKYLFCQGRGPLTQGAIESGSNVIVVPDLVREIHPARDVRAFWYLWKCFRREKFDVVHTHSSKTGVIGRLAARWAGVPCIVHTVHGFAFPAAKSLLQKRVFHAMEWIGARCSHRVICLHEDDAKICRDRLGLSNKRIEIMPNGIDLQKFYPLSLEVDREALRVGVGFPADRKLVMMVGRLWEQKNPECLVEAYCQLWESGDPGADLVLVGDGALKEPLEARVKLAGLESHVHFLGWRTDTPRLLRLCDVFVLPSRWEGMPLAILEAMGCGLPVIVSDIPGNRHLVHHEKNGLLFPVGNAGSLASALVELLENASLRIRLGAAGRAKVEAEHDIQQRVRNMEALYRDVLSAGD